jgi:hypothetical protein
LLQALSFAMQLSPHGLPALHTLQQAPAAHKGAAVVIGVTSASVIAPSKIFMAFPLFS